MVTIISGGQTGADIAGLRAAKRCGIKTGGTAPKGWMTEYGPRPELQKVYGLKEYPFGGSYVTRTKSNVINSDVTLLCVRQPKSPGSKLTKELCSMYKKPCLTIYFNDGGSVQSGQMDAVRDWLWKHNPSVINIAGNRESKSPGIEKGAEEFLYLLFITCGYQEETRRNN